MLNMPRSKAVKLVNHVLAGAPTKGIFGDQWWLGVKQVWRALDDAGVPYHLTDNRYENDGQEMPVRKIWTFEVPCENGVVYGRVTAAGAGSVQDPLERYDVTAYAS